MNLHSSFGTLSKRGLMTQMTLIVALLICSCQKKDDKIGDPQKKSIVTSNDYKSKIPDLIAQLKVADKKEQTAIIKNFENKNNISFSEMDECTASPELILMNEAPGSPENIRFVTWTLLQNSYSFDWAVVRGTVFPWEVVSRDEAYGNSGDKIIHINHVYSHMTGWDCNLFTWTELFHEQLPQIGATTAIRVAGDLKINLFPAQMVSNVMNIRVDPF